MIVIVDYGVGNLFSLKSSFAAIGFDVTVTGDKAEIEAEKTEITDELKLSFADRISLPLFDASDFEEQMIEKYNIYNGIRCNPCRFVPK